MPQSSYFSQLGKSQSSHTCTREGSRYTSTLALVMTLEPSSDQDTEPVVLSAEGPDQLQGSQPAAGDCEISDIESGRQEPVEQPSIASGPVESKPGPSGAASAECEELDASLGSSQAQPCSEPTRK